MDAIRILEKEMGVDQLKLFNSSTTSKFKRFTTQIYILSILYIFNTDVIDNSLSSILLLIMNSVTPP